MPFVHAKILLRSFERTRLMTQFEFLSVALSFALGLAVTVLLTSLLTAFRARRTTRRISTTISSKTAGGPLRSSVCFRRLQ